MTYSGASWIRLASRKRRVESGLDLAGDGLDEEAMLRHREGMLAVGLAVPTGDAGEPVRDVLDLDVERRGVEQVEPPSAQHPLPGPRSTLLSGGAIDLSVDLHVSQSRIA